MNITQRTDGLDASGLFDEPGERMELWKSCAMVLVLVGVRFLGDSWLTDITA